MSMGHLPPPPQAEPLPCPRCDSTNTKFCYYNNYNLSQPRHFCKSCRRYWTHGGTLRDVPVGGGSRKNSKRSRSSPASSSSSAATTASSSSSSDPLPTSAPIIFPDHFHLSKPEPASDDLNLNPNPNPNPDLNENVSSGLGFTSLLNSQTTGLLALGGYGFGLGLGQNNGFDQEMGFGYGKGVWPFPEVGDFAGNGGSGGNTWQMNGGSEGGLVDGDCFANWPDLTISMTGKGFK